MYKNVKFFKMKQNKMAILTTTIIISIQFELTKFIYYFILLYVLIRKFNILKLISIAYCDYFDNNHPKNVFSWIIDLFSLIF